MAGRELHVVGISFRTAGEDVREGLAFSPSQVSELLARARTSLPDVELVVLSTCNRTELYVGGGADTLAQVHEVLREVRPTAPRLDGGCARYHLTGPDAYRHLLRVACGLESALLGDAQVLGQVRGALTLAQEAGTLGAVLSPALSDALRTGRQARARTAIGRGSPGVGAAAAHALVSRGLPPSAKVLVVGTGRAARLVSRAAVKAGYRSLEVVGRRPDATAALASECGAVARPWEQLLDAVLQADAVLVATGAPEPVLRDVPAGRLVVDAGFPRQVEASSCSAELVSLLALSEEADAAAEARRSAVPAVEELVAEQVARWALARTRQPLEETIKRLHQEAARATKEAAERLSLQAGLDAADVERVLGRQVRRVLHEHVEVLRSWRPA